MAFLPLDGPALQGQTSLTTTTVFRVKVGAEELVERNVVTIQNITGNIWVYFGEDSIVPTATEVRNKGFQQTKGILATYEAGARQKIYILADVITVDVRFAERS
jgi:hypothetical protein